MTKSEKRLIWLTILNFFFTPAFAMAITITNKHFTSELFQEMVTSWPFIVSVNLFTLGVPLLLAKMLKTIRGYRVEKNINALNKSYINIQVVFLVALLTYGLITIPILQIVGFDLQLIKFMGITAILYLFVAAPPVLLLFNRIIDDIFENSDITKTISLKFKFTIVTVFSTIGGLGLVILSIKVLLWRYTNNPEMGLTFEDILARILLVSGMVFLLQIVPNMMIGSRFTSIFLALSKYINNLRNKDLSHQLKSIPARDEFGDTAYELYELGKHLEEIVIQLTSNSENLQSSGDVIKDISQTNSDLASSLASSAEEVASSLEEITSNLNWSSENANQSVAINVESEQSMEKAQSLSEITLNSIRDISEKVKLIEEISSQTDLIAINAYIEAANAGEHGKGFTVLAREVRGLADKTREALKSISEASDNCILYSEESKIKIDESVAIARKTTELSSQIANSSKEQLASVELINSAVQEFNSSTQTIASSSQELASTSLELGISSGKMHKSVKAFKLNK